MDVTTRPVAASITHSVAEDDGELTEEQMQALLKQAEVNLRERNSSNSDSQVQLRSAAAEFKLPKLNATDVPAPYIQTNGDVARVDPSRLVDAQQRELANSIRKVEDPVAVKKKQIEVSHSCFLSLRL